MRILSGRTPAVQIQSGTLESEGEIHGVIEAQAGVTVGNIEIFIVSSESSTRTGVRADIIGLDKTGHVVILELKQSGSGRSGSRTALTQALEYGADFRSVSYCDLDEMYADYTNADHSLVYAHADYFDLDVPLRERAFTMATEPRLVLLAERFSASDIDAARYLRDVNDVDITCVEVTPFDVEGDRVYGFACRLETKTTPHTLLSQTGDEALPWLTRKLEHSYSQRFGNEFGIDSPEHATKRADVYKSHRFVSSPDHPDDLRYTFKVRAFDDHPVVEFGVSPDGHERIESIIDTNRESIVEEHRFEDRNWRRVRGEASLDDILSDAQLETVSPEASETVSRVLWNDERFQSVWEEFLCMVERWHEIIDRELNDDPVRNSAVDKEP